MPTSRATMPTKCCPSQKVVGYVISEIVVVIFIIGLLCSMAAMNAVSLLGRNTFKAQANDLVETFNKAWSTARSSERRYEVVLDISNQSYMLREISGANLADVLEEEIISQKKLRDDLRIKYVMFDDFENTAAVQGAAMFRAGHAGWQAGGKIVLVDRGGNEYSLIISRLSPIAQLKNGDVKFAQPQDDVPF